MGVVDVDVVVVGSGIMGAATAWRLSRGERSVVLLEQFEVGHARGSSHGASRIFRFSYDDPLYVRMAMDALPLWRELEDESGRSILAVLGGLDWGRDLDAHTSALADCGAEFDLIDGAEARRRFPTFAPPNSEPVLYQPDAGIVDAGVALRTMVKLAVDAGVELREQSPVIELGTDRDWAEARTDGESFRARTIVVTAGAWAAPLLRGVEVELPVQVFRQTVAYFPAETDVAPPIAVDWSDSTVFYALPSPGTGIKVGEHQVRTLADPDDEGAPDRGWVAGLEGWVADRVPGAGRKAVHAETCLYTNTSDERFILERHGPIVVGSACSGHAFKFAPLIGERLAALALEP
jgi:sarcosine oxidase